MSRIAKNKVTSYRLAEMKASGEPISVLTAYDYPTAKLLDECGIDIILVGDSLAEVALGFDNTLNATLDDMIRHCAAVKRGTSRAMALADMPFMSFQVNDDETLRNAGRLLAEGGAEAVKLEGGVRSAAIVRRIVDAGIPVVGHIGLTPQSIHALGYKRQGAGEAAAKALMADAVALESAGACAIVLEMVKPEVAAEITRELAIPTIGIGSGPDCDGQVLVVHDVLGLSDEAPKFAKKYADVRAVMREAFLGYVKEVKGKTFPTKK